MRHHGVPSEFYQAHPLPFKEVRHSREGGTRGSWPAGGEGRGREGCFADGAKGRKPFESLALSRFGTILPRMCLEKPVVSTGVQRNECCQMAWLAQECHPGAALTRQGRGWLGAAEKSERISQAQTHPTPQPPHTPAGWNHPLPRGSPPLSATVASGHTCARWRAGGSCAHLPPQLRIRQKRAQRKRTSKRRPNGVCARAARR